MANTPSAKPKLYYLLCSPPCHLVMAVARLLDIELDLKEIDYFAGEHKTDEYAKMNLCKTVPTFIDTDGFTLYESRAIATYLVQSRKPDSNLYPRDDLKKRTLIDMYLQFDLGKFYRIEADLLDDFWTMGEINHAKVPAMIEVLQTFDAILAHNGTSFIAGDHLTVADLSIYFYWLEFELIPEIDTSPYKAIQAWNHKVAEALKPVNGDGLFYEKYMNSMLKFAEVIRQKMNYQK